MKRIALLALIFCFATGTALAARQPEATFTPRCDGSQIDIHVSVRHGRVRCAELWEAHFLSPNQRRDRFENVMQMQPQGGDFHLSVSLPEYEYKKFYVRLVFDRPADATLRSQTFTADASNLLTPNATPEGDMLYGDISRTGVPFSKDPHVIRFGGRYLMYYSIPPRPDDKASGWNIGIAESRDLRQWEKVGELTPAEGLEYESRGLCAPCALVRDGEVHLFYQTYGGGRSDAICHAVSSDGLTFRRNPTNPIFSPKGEGWTCGRAIDAEVCEFRGRYYLYFATRDTDYRRQQLGVATAPAGTDFSRDAWTQAADTTILFPLLPWEKNCIEAPSICIRGGRMYMFYAGAYNNEPQQVGVAVSRDGIHWQRLSDEPFLANGPTGSWNESESGHPHIFTDRDGKTYLFYQGNRTHGKNWFLSQRRVVWKRGKPKFGK